MPERAFQPGPRQNISRLHPALNHFRAALFLSLLGFVPLCGNAQNEAPPPASKAAVRITFLPPPIDGTLSLGIYDKTGNLVRTLHREAEAEKDFTVGLNGLITVWDGKNDAGQAVPPGKYSARGYAVGEVQIEGVAMHCNDWITDDDSPRVARMVSFSPRSSNDEEDIPVDVILASGTSATLHVTPTGKIRSFEPREVNPEDMPGERPRDAFHHETRIGETKYAIRNGQLVKSTSSAPWQELKLPGLVSATFFCTTGADPAGLDFWIIDQTPAGHEVKLYSEAANSNAD
jgi:hypothetical protein